MAEPTSSSGGDLWGKIHRWVEIHPHWTITLAVFAALGPFLAKPFNIDDPLFVWAAGQIQAHPVNPYGFNVNWYGELQPMASVTENPPLMCYYLALAAGIFGRNEIGLHFACLLPAVVVVLGTYRLARNCCRWPLFAALATMFTPGFLVSGTSVMCDVSLLAFWIWAVVFWTEGIRQHNGWKLSAAGTLVALALLTKYYGVCLIPLLAVHGWLERRTAVRWAAYLLIPVAAFCAYEWLTLQLYGQPLFVAATHYVKSLQTSHRISSLVKVANALTFTGGGFAIALFCAPFLWRKRVLAMLAAGAGAFTALALASGMMAKNYAWFDETVCIRAEIQILFWSVGGVCVLALALADVRQKRDSSSGLLLLWVLGTFLFASFVNWTVNVRSLLPIAPAIAILIARRLEQNKPRLPGGIKSALVASAAFSLLAAQSDFMLASAVRQNAKQVCAKYATASRTL